MPRRDHPHGRPAQGWRSRLHEIIFEAETPAGKAFDVGLLAAIALSTLTALLETVGGLRETNLRALRVAEWGFTGLFTVEYVLRLISVRRPLRYALSFFGLIDLLAVVPTYLSLFVTGAQSLVVVRSLRLLRVFRVFHLGRFLGEANLLLAAIRSAGPKITVFLGAVLTVVVIMGTLMYLIEGEENGFTSIPRAMYWAIVTMTTVGYGDIAPQTVLGQALASMLMVLGYSIIAVPTGIVSLQLARPPREGVTTTACLACSREGHDGDAKFCKFCGEKL